VAKDEWHFNTDSMIKLGERYAVEMLRIKSR